MADERNRILNLLEEGKISAEQAATLLDALNNKASASARGNPGQPNAHNPGVIRSKPPARLLRISIDAHEHAGGTPTKVRINVPLALARFASQFVPSDARAELEGQNINLSALLEGLGDELPEGPLVDIDANEGEGKTARILIEVV